MKRRCNSQRRAWACAAAMATALSLVIGANEASAQPAPARPAPAQPAPGQPAPGQPAPGQPAPGQPAPAQPPPGEEAKWEEATKLFDEGRVLLTRPRDLAKACEALTQSYALRQRGDVLLNLAECHRRQGKTATAWREFDEAIRYAVDVEFREAIDAAVTRRDELALTLSELYVEVDEKSLPEGTTVLLDGKKLPSQQWNARLFVDPGIHAVSTTAPGFEPFEGSVEVPPNAKGTVIRATPTAIPPPPPVVPPPPKVAPPEPKPAQLPPAEKPVWPYVVGGAGIVAMAVSVVFVVDSTAAGNDLDDVCGAERRNSCPVGFDYESPRGREIRGFGLFVGLGVAGLAATTVGVLGFALSGDGKRESAMLAPWASPEGAGLTVRGVGF